MVWMKDFAANLPVTSQLASSISSEKGIGYAGR